MRNTLLPFLLFISLGFLSAQPNDLSFTEIPESLLANANDVVRYEHTEIHIQDYDHLRVKYHKITTLINEQSNEDGLVIHYNSFKKVSKIKAKIYDALGELIREIEKDEINDYSAVSGFSIYEDSRVKYLDIDYKEYPYTVELEYEYVTKRFMVFPRWIIQGYGQSVEEGHLTVSYPSEYNLRYKAYNTDLKEEEGVANDRKTLTWNVTDLPAIKKESYMPKYHESLPLIFLAPSNFKLGKYKGDMSNWESLGRFMYELNQGRDELSEQMKLKVNALVKDATTDREKIEILYKYLQDNMRYVSVQLGVGGYQTFDAAYVEKNEYGDCKALTNFMMSMLKEVGIPANNALINSGSGTLNPDQDFAQVLFNHVILYVPGEKLFLECTSSSAPVGYLGTDNFNKPVLIVDKSGGKIIKTPTWNFAQNSKSTKTTIEFVSSSVSKISNESLLTGGMHDLYRYAKNNMSETDFKEYFLEHFALNVKSVESLDITVEENEPAAKLTYNLLVSQMGSKAGKRVFIPLNKIHGFSRKLPKSSTRESRIFIEGGYTEENEILIQFPEHYDLENYPNESISFSSDYGSYSLELISHEKGLLYKRRLEVKPVNAPAEDYDKIRDFYKKVTKSDNTKLVLKDNKA